MKQSRSAKKPTAPTEPTESAAPVLSDLDLPEDGGIRLKLPGFEGPLDLLLHLIQEHELDILNIPIAFVTKRYLEYIDLMQVLNIDIASEYLVMAATLVHIKSRMLLPTPPADLEEGEEEELDPRAELIRRLLEYQKYKKAAEELASRSVLGRDIFTRGALPTSDPTTAPLAPVSSFKLLEAFERVLSRAKIVIDHQIEFERFSLSDRINQLVDMLKNRGRVIFDELFEGQRSRPDLIVTFLALLELTRLRMTRLFQDAPLEPIFVELSVTDEEAAARETGMDEPAAVEARVDEAGVDEADVDEADVDEADVDEADVDETGVDEAGVDETDVDEADVDEADVDEADVDEADVDEADVDEASALSETGHPAQFEGSGAADRLELDSRDSAFEISDAAGSGDVVTPPMTKAGPNEEDSTTEIGELDFSASRSAMSDATIGLETPQKDPNHERMATDDVDSESDITASASVDLDLVGSDSTPRSFAIPEPGDGAASRSSVADEGDQRDAACNSMPFEVAPDGNDIAIDLHQTATSQGESNATESTAKAHDASVQNALTNGLLVDDSLCSDAVGASSNDAPRLASEPSSALASAMAGDEPEAESVSTEETVILATDARADCFDPVDSRPSDSGTTAEQSGIDGFDAWHPADRESQSEPADENPEVQHRDESQAGSPEQSPTPMQGFLTADEPLPMVNPVAVEAGQSSAEPGDVGQALANETPPSTDDAATPSADAELELK